jgi:hypothetical protein
MKKIYNLFRDNIFVASFSDPGRGFRYAENIAALDEIIPELFRSRWVQNKDSHTLLNTGFELRKCIIDPVMEVEFEPDVIEGEISPLKELADLNKEDK